MSQPAEWSPLTSYAGEPTHFKHEPQSGENVFDLELSPSLLVSPGYHGGPIQRKPELYLIWWGSGWASGKGLESYHEVKAFYEDLATGGIQQWQNILSQYGDTAGAGPGHAASVHQVSIASPQPTKLHEGSVSAEIHTVIKEQKWEVADHPEAQVIALLGANATFQGEEAREKEAKGEEPQANWPNIRCAQHNTETSEGYVTAWVPYAGNKYFLEEQIFRQGLPTEERRGPCVYGFSKAEREANAVHETTALASHEYAEAATDPKDPNGGWFGEVTGEKGSELAEIADYCELYPAIEVAGTGIWVAELWDNKDKSGETNEAGCKWEDIARPPIPEVKTKPANEVNPVENGEEISDLATLHGEMNPNGPVEEEQYHFVYETGSEKQATANTHISSGEGFVAASATVTGLRYCATYKYRIIGSNLAGESQGNEEPFTTPCPKPAAVTSTASNILHQSATMRGTVNPRNSDTHYWFEWGETKGTFTHSTEHVDVGSAYSEVKEVSKNEKFYPGGTYYYRIAAENKGGTSTGSEQTFSTPGEPEFVSGPTVSGVTETGEATLSSVINPEGRETKYTLEYSLGTEHLFVNQNLGAGLANVEVKSVLKGLSHQRQYTDKVEAKNPDGTVSKTGQFITGPVTIGPLRESFVTKSQEVKFFVTKGAEWHCMMTYGGTSGTTQQNFVTGTPAFTGCEMTIVATKYPFTSTVQGCSNPWTMTLKVERGGTVSEEFGSLALTCGTIVFTNAALGCTFTLEPVTWTNGLLWKNTGHHEIAAVVSTAYSSKWKLGAACELFLGSGVKGEYRMQWSADLPTLEATL